MKLIAIVAKKPFCPPTGTLLCFALMYAVATGANLIHLNPIDAQS